EHGRCHGKTFRAFTGGRGLTEDRSADRGLRRAGHTARAHHVGRQCALRFRRQARFRTPRVLSCHPTTPHTPSDGTHRQGASSSTLVTLAITGCTATSTRTTDVRVRFVSRIDNIARFLVDTFPTKTLTPSTRRAWLDVASTPHPEHPGRPIGPTPQGQGEGERHASSPQGGCFSTLAAVPHHRREPVPGLCGCGDPGPGGTAGHLPGGVPFRCRPCRVHRDADRLPQSPIPRGDPDAGPDERPGHVLAARRGVGDQTGTTGHV